MSAIDYHALFRTAADGMLVIDSSHRSIDVNETFAGMVGATRDALVGRASTEIVFQTDLHLHATLLESLSRERSVFTLRQLRHTDGSAIPVEIRATRMADGSTFGIVRDVRRRPLTDALRVAESRLRAMAESLNVGVVVSDQNNRALYANEHDSRLTGYRFEDVVGFCLAPRQPRGRRRCRRFREWCAPPDAGDGCSWWKTSRACVRRRVVCSSARASP